MCASRKKQPPGKEVCLFFSRKGWCRYGSSCWFQHGEPVVKAKQSEPEIEIEKMMEGMQVLTHSGETEVQDDGGHINLLRKGADREAILTTAILRIMIVAACHTAAEGCLWLGVIDSLIFLIIWHVAVVLTCVAWMGSWFWKQEPRLHDVTWACEAITSMAHLLPLLMALGHLVLYCGYSGVKITVSKLGFKYTVPEGKGGDGGVVIQTPFGKILMMISDALRGEYKGVFKDPS
jgi:hypothetical protein